jgi:hypothetical protein
MLRASSEQSVCFFYYSLVEYLDVFLEGFVDGLLDVVSESLVGGEPFSALGGESGSSAVGTTALSVHQADAETVFGLFEVAPGLSIANAEVSAGGGEGALLVDGLEQSVLSIAKDTLPRSAIEPELAAYGESFHLVCLLFETTELTVHDSDTVFIANFPHLYLGHAEAFCDLKGLGAGELLCAVDFFCGCGDCFDQLTVLGHVGSSYCYAWFDITPLLYQPSASFQRKEHASGVLQTGTLIWFIWA